MTLFFKKLSTARVSITRTGYILALTLASCLCVFAQQPSNEKNYGPPPEPKNLKVLTGMTGAQVIQVMRGINAALSVQCNYCHIVEKFDLDEKPTKQTARMMLTMAREINAKFADGKQHVTCYTCHRGAKEPATAPPAPAEGAAQH